MRICFSTYPTAFQRPGGGEVVIGELRRALQQRGHDVELFDLWTTRLDGVDVFHHFASLGSDVLSHVRAYVGAVALTPTMWPELPTRVRLLRWALARHARRPFEAADVVFPASCTEGRLLVKNYHVPADRIVVVPNGIDERFAAEPTGEFARLHGLRRYVLIPGRIDPVKNQLRVLRALRECDFDVVVLGEPAGGQEAYFEACRAAAGPRTHFVPPVPYESDVLVDAVAGAACVVVASIYETWSLTAHEAGLAGTPIACTTGGALREHLGTAAEYFHADSDAEICAAVERAVKRGRRTELREQLLRSRSWTDIAELIESAYLDALGRR